MMRTSAALPVGILLSLLLLGCGASEPGPTARVVTDSTSTSSTYTNAYGLPGDSLLAFRGRVRYGETLSDLLRSRGISPRTVADFRSAAGETFDVDQLRAGDAYRFYESVDAPGELRYLVYEPDPTTYVVFDLTAPIDVIVGRHPVRTAQRAVAGVVERSLYESLQETDAPIAVALELSEVFAWQVDFYRIQPGDRYKVIYEQRRVQGQPVGVGRILGAYFEHADTSFYAVYFDQGNGGDYFDGQGRSLRKQFLKAPLQFQRISSRYSRSRYHPVANEYRAHLGTDYAAAPGTPVRSVGDGTVAVAGYDRANGRWVKIRHNGTYSTGYLHLSGIADGIREGVEVRQGEVIGYVGSTGLATGPHLHYHFWKNGRAVDPTTVELPPSEPIDEEYRPAYERRRADVVETLEQISYPQNRELTGPLALALSPASTAPDPAPAR